MHMWPGETLNIRTWKAIDSESEHSNCYIVEACVDRSTDAEQGSVSTSESQEIEKTLADIKNWYDGERGMTKYDPQVTLRQHALQTAEIAQKNGCSDNQLIAALLHDIGHLVLDEHKDNEDFLVKDRLH